MQPDDNVRNLQYINIPNLELGAEQLLMMKLIKVIQKVVSW